MIVAALIVGAAALLALAARAVTRWGDGLNTSAEGVLDELQRAVDAPYVRDLPRGRDPRCGCPWCTPTGRTPA